MNQNSVQGRLTSFILSAMLTSAFLTSTPGATLNAQAGPQPQAVMNALEGLRAAGFQGTQNIVPTALPAAPKAASTTSDVVEAPSLSNAQIQKLLQLIAEKGNDATLYPSVTNALGLNAGSGRQFTILQKSTQITHALQKINSDEGYVFISVKTDGFRSYRTDARQQLVTAVSYQGEETPASIGPTEAKTGLNAELAFWGIVANKF